MAERDGFDDLDDTLPDADEEDGDDDDDASEPAQPMILIVVGAHLRAEAADRPLAYALREKALMWLNARFPAPDDSSPTIEGDEPPVFDPGDPRPGHPCSVVVCTDVWYLNDASLRVWPTISLGGPGVNALSAYLTDKLPGVLVVDDVLMIQMDPELAEATAAVWGIDHRATISAVDAFAERYLDAFMTAATRGWE
jgi:hypothetical protein